MYRGRAIGWGVAVRNACDGRPRATGSERSARCGRESRPPDRSSRRRGACGGVAGRGCGWSRWPELVLPHVPKKVQVGDVLVRAPGQAFQQPKREGVAQMQALPLPDHRERRLVEQRAFHRIRRPRNKPVGTVAEVRFIDLGTNGGLDLPAQMAAVIRASASWPASAFSRRAVSASIADSVRRPQTMWPPCPNWPASFRSITCWGLSPGPHWRALGAVCQRISRHGDGNDTAQGV